VLGTSDAGVLVPPNDPSALADRILGFARDSELRRHLGAANRSAAQDRSARARPEAEWTQLLANAVERRRS
jgi:glycosyltransferase involved in cell wall biosynthesis